MNTSTLSLEDFLEKDFSIENEDCEAKFLRRIPPHLVLPATVPESPSSDLCKLTPKEQIDALHVLAESRIMWINGDADDPWAMLQMLSGGTLSNIHYGDKQEKNRLVENLCDECDEVLPWTHDRYTNSDNDKDLCMECTQKAPHRIAEWNLTLCKVDVAQQARALEQESQFGQLFDWAPLYMGTDDECGSYIMICGNPASSLYGRFALVTDDDHGRIGIGTCTADTTLLQLLAEYAEFNRDRPVSAVGEGWGAFYSMPIKRMMKKRQMQIHYG